MRTFVLGDSHGAHKAFVQVLERSQFDYKKDRLICLGDVSDGWPEVPELIEELMKIKKLIMIMGNHDQWLLNWLDWCQNPPEWSEQGGKATLEAYVKRRPELMIPHREWLKKAPYYYLDDKNRLFVHGGVFKGKELKEHTPDELMWTRGLWHDRHNSDQHRIMIQRYKEVYVGHTTIYNFSHKPLKYGNVWFMDTGGGWEGVLSMMEINSKQIYQSDKVSDLYPEVRGRN